MTNGALTPRTPQGHQGPTTIHERLGNVFHSVHNVVMKARQWLPLLKEGAKALQLPFDDGGGNVNPD